MSQQLIQTAQENFGKTIEHFQHEITTLRTGRASAGLLAAVTVESYGSHMPITQLATVSVPEARSLLVTPWDKTQLPQIEKAILQANLGLTPSNDGNVIRIKIPSPTEERRKEMVKVLGQMAEKSRISVRNTREDANKQMKKMTDDGDISKDDLIKLQKQLQDMVDKINIEIKQIAEEKEKEIMTM